MKALTIGQAAKVTGIKVVTIRFYEKLGLLPAPARTGGNYRAFDMDQLHTLQFIRGCRDLGFTLDQVRELLRLSSQKDMDCDKVDRLTARHLADVERKIADLERLAKELRRLGNCCQGGGPIADCQIIQALSPNA